MNRRIYHYSYTQNATPHTFTIEEDDNGNLVFPPGNIHVLPESQIKRLVDSLLTYVMEKHA